jgi:1,5-anhydro-D-fructose reductase (1,5-anhydro-D-mannitol-forming)
MTDRVRVGWSIVGLGNIARRVATSIGALSNSGLVNVCSRDADRAATFATEYKAISSTDSFAELLADDAVDVVYVATPNVLHAQQSIEALAAGKHVLVEKPMALTLSDAEQMATAARSADRLLGVGFHLRHHPVHREVRRRIRDGEAGAIVLVSAEWSSSGTIPADLWHIDPALAGLGSLGGLGVHMLDLVPWLVDDEVVEVVALDDGTSHGKVEFLTVATLRLAGGALAQVVCSRRLPQSTQSVTVFGSAERLEAHRTLSMGAQGELRVTTAAGTESLAPQITDLYDVEIEAFADAVLGRRPLEAPAEDGVRSVALTEAVQEAARSGATRVRHSSDERMRADG